MCVNHQQSNQTDRHTRHRSSLTPQPRPPPIKERRMCVVTRGEISGEFANQCTHAHDNTRRLCLPAEPSIHPYGRGIGCLVVVFVVQVVLLMPTRRKADGRCCAGSPTMNAHDYLLQVAWICLMIGKRCPCMYDRLVRIAWLLEFNAAGGGNNMASTRVDWCNFFGPEQLQPCCGSRTHACLAFKRTHTKLPSLCPTNFERLYWCVRTCGRLVYSTTYDESIPVPRV